jgi:hypothetical protein
MDKFASESLVFALLEEIEIAAACSACGRLSFHVLGGESCPHCCTEEGACGELARSPGPHKNPIKSKN